MSTSPAPGSSPQTPAPADKQPALSAVLKAAESLVPEELRELRAWVEARLAGSGEPQPGEPEALSVREEEALRLIARGYSNKQIAALMSVSVKTAETYKARGMEKLKLRTRVQLVSYAIERGWFQPG